MHNWKLELPYPLSINKKLKLGHLTRQSPYWSRAMSTYLLTQKKYRQEVFVLFKQSKLKKWEDQMLKMTIEIYCPDKRQRDSDGIIKELFDAMQEAKVFDNDYQIKKYCVERMDETVKNGKVVIQLESIDI